MPPNSQHSTEVELPKIDHLRDSMLGLETYKAVQKTYV